LALQGGETVTDQRIAPLLDLDPDLGQLLEGDRLAAARRELRVGIHTLEAGPWEVDKLSGASPEHIGLLVVDGVLAREVLVSDTVSTELLGPGDVVRPWRLVDGESLLRHSVRWNVLSRSRIALLDRRFAAQLGTFPEINAAIIDRVNERALRLAVTQAISQLNRVDRRLLALFWHLAERWGRMTKDGVALPMTLSHRMLGQLIGARRPTVSTALGELAGEGELVRRNDGTWLLTGAPVGVPEPEIERVIPMRRRLLPPERAGALAPVVAIARAAPPPVEAVTIHSVDMHAVLERLRAECQSKVAEMQHSYERAVELAARTEDLRAQCRATRESRTGTHG
jgi:CRP/FNR family transcriptional regulator, cyclic AMP receptor protein